MYVGGFFVLVFFFIFFLFSAVAWELLRWVSALCLALGTDPCGRATAVVEAMGWWLKQGMQLVVLAFEPWLWDVPRAGGGGDAPVPGETLLPAGLGLASLAARALQCWHLHPGSRVQWWAGLGKGLGTQRGCLGRRRGRGSAGRQWHRESCRVVSVARALVSVTKQHRST